MCIFIYDHLTVLLLLRKKDLPPSLHVLHCHIKLEFLLIVYVLGSCFGLLAVILAIKKKKKLNPKREKVCGLTDR